MAAAGVPLRINAARLTPAGQAKLERVLQRVGQELEVGAAREVIAMRNAAAGFAPSPDEEAVLLSRGVAAGGVFAGQTLGDPEEGRFLRAGGNVPIREAIATSRIVQRRAGPQLEAGTAEAGAINQRTGFSWTTRKRGIQGPTQPFNRAYVQALENGGAVWTVTPRPDNPSQILEPETSVLTRAMVKTLPPRGMFRRARAFRQAAARRNLAAAARRGAREASRT